MYLNSVRRLQKVGVEYQILTRVSVRVIVRLSDELSLSEHSAGSIQAYIPLVLEIRVGAGEYLSSWINVFLDRQLYHVSRSPDSYSKLSQSFETTEYHGIPSGSMPPWLSCSNLAPAIKRQHSTVLQHIQYMQMSDLTHTV